MHNNKVRIQEKLEWGRFVSPLSDKNIIPFNWYEFKHRFGSELVSKVFSMFGLRKGNVVFDPFCGGGTTLIKAKLDGYTAAGLDLSPFSVFLTNALTTTYHPDRLKGSLKIISHEVNPKAEIPDVAILNKSFSNLTLKYIYSLRDSINSLDAPERDFFLFSLLSILNSVSKAKKSGGFLRITNQRKVPIRVVKTMFVKTSEKLINDIKSLNYQNVSATAILGDARDYPSSLKHQKFDAILTSPPYLNRHDYTRIYELELLVGFIRSNLSLKSLRYDTLRSHVEAKKKYEVNSYIGPLLLEEKIRELKKRELNNNKIISTIYGYFEDMYLCLKEMFDVLKKGKYIGLVVSNVRFAGVMIPVDELLAEIGEQVGLRANSIFVLRYRGNSSQQMLRHKREPTRESLVVWQK
jgi:DNA modification methylase